MIPSDYYAYALGRESGGDPYAANPRSNARGLYQFLPGTWADVSRKHPELGLTTNGIYDRAQQEAAMRAFTDDNALALDKAGIPIDKNSLYAAHRFGAQGAVSAFSADPNTPAETVFGSRVIAANPDLAGKTVGDILGNKAPVGNKTPMPDPQYTQIFPQGRLYASQAQPDNSGWSLRDGGVLYNDGQPKYDLGSGLINAGASLASISDPRQGSVLAALGAQTQGRYTTQYDKDSGTILRIDNKTGQVTATRNPAWPGEKVPEGTLKDLAERTGTQGELSRITGQASKFMKAIDSGELDLGLANQGQAAWESALGKSSPKTQLYNEFQSFRNQLELAEQLAQKGPQTEADAGRMFKAFLSGVGQYDNATARQALGNLIEKNRIANKDYGTTLDAYSNATKNPNAFKPYYLRQQEFQAPFGEYDTYAKSRADAAKRPPLDSFFIK